MAGQRSQFHTHERHGRKRYHRDCRTGLRPPGFIGIVQRRAHSNPGNRQSGNVPHGRRSYTANFRSIPDDCLLSGGICRLIPLVIRIVRASAIALPIVLAACASNRPPPAPEFVIPWGAVDYEAEQPAVIMPKGRQSALPVSRSIARDLKRNARGVYEYPGITISGGGSHGAWGAGFLKGWAETGKRPEFRIVTAMSAGALMATSAFLGPEYDYLMTTVFVESSQDDLYSVGPLSITAGLFGSGHFASVKKGEELLSSLYTDHVINAVGAAYQGGRRLYLLTANFDDDRPTLWDMGAIASSSEPDRYSRFRKVLQAAIAVPAAFPPVYFPVEVKGQTYGQMHLDAGTNFVFLLDFMVGEDAEFLARAQKLSEVEGVLYVIMNTQRKNPISKNHPAARHLVWSGALTRELDDLPPMAHWTGFGSTGGSVTHVSRLRRSRRSWTYRSMCSSFRNRQWVSSLRMGVRQRGTTNFQKDLRAFPNRNLIAIRSNRQANSDSETWIVESERTDAVQTGSPNVTPPVGFAAGHWLCSARGFCNTFGRCHSCPQ